MRPVDSHFISVHTNINSFSLFLTFVGQGHSLHTSPMKHTCASTQLIQSQDFKELCGSLSMLTRALRAKDSCMQMSVVFANSLLPVSISLSQTHTASFIHSKSLSPTLSGSRTNNMSCSFSPTCAPTQLI